MVQTNGDEQSTIIIKKNSMYFDGGETATTKKRERKYIQEREIYMPK